MTPFQLHVQKWSNGCGANICQTANRVVLARGQLPADVLFVGEAPGESEDVLGKPFVGPAGRLLDDIVRRSVGVLNVRRATESKQPFRIAFTNLVGCIPRDPEDGGKASEPDADSIRCCGERLQQILEIASPRVVVCVGSMSRDWLKRGYRNPVEVPHEVQMIDITHPAAILRANVSVRQIMAQRCVVTLTDLLEDLP